MENATARNTRVGLYLCPSDGEPNHLNSYRLNRGRWLADPNTLYDGPFSITVIPSQQTVTDGLATTAFLSERTAGSFVAGSRDPMRDLKSPSSNIPGLPDAQFIPLCLEDQPGQWYPLAGRYWFYSGFTNGNYNHNGQPNDPRPTCLLAGNSPNTTGGLSPPRSFHPGAVNVLFGDGHVQRVLDSINPQIWMALGTYNAGDIPAGF